MRKQLLIVDDQKINILLLKKILSSEYDIISADNGKTALDILKSNRGKMISAVILDLVMPIMDGFEFLSLIRNDSGFNELPVIVMTGSNQTDDEEKALEYGAWDFITKPYNVKILKHRIKNVILRSRMTAFERLRYMAEYDKLTGIHNKARFLADTEKMIKANCETDFVIYRFDILRFKLINSFFGVKAGDKLLKYIADNLSSRYGKDSLTTFGRIESDIFAVCKPFDSEEKSSAEIADISSFISGFSNDFMPTTIFGIYVIKDKSLAVNLMLDRATLAAKTAKHSDMGFFAYYREEMQQSLEREQRVTDEMRSALKNGEFKDWYQPKFNLKTKKLSGAEALVRWVHPQRGIIPPGEFIPTLEHNGFITHLDKYIWEQVCINMKDRIDKGLKVVPVSINVSRVDLFSAHFAEELKSLLTKYSIPSYLFNLEITESIFTKDISVFSDTLAELKKDGFIILMDDFGSGYSSLNVLKDMDVDILKIDMQFFSETENKHKSRRIIEFVIKMAHAIGISVIAEGVEKPEQAEFLGKAGCDEVQGYLFSKPIALNDYNKMLENNL